MRREEALVVNGHGLFRVMVSFVSGRALARESREVTPPEHCIRADRWTRQALVGVVSGWNWSR
jgi:hypothetical protein